MTAKELIDLFDSKNETRVLPIFNYVSEHYPTFNHPKIDLGNEIFKALTELEELKNNKIIIDKEDAKRYLNVFERKVLKQIVKEIEDNKKLSNVGAKDV